MVAIDGGDAALREAVAARARSRRRPRACVGRRPRPRRRGGRRGRCAASSALDRCRAVAPAVRRAAGRAVHRVGVRRDARRSPRSRRARAARRVRAASARSATRPRSADRPGGGRARAPDRRHGRDRRRRHDYRRARPRSGRGRTGRPARPRPGRRRYRPAAAGWHRSRRVRTRRPGQRPPRLGAARGRQPDSRTSCRTAAARSRAWLVREGVCTDLARAARAACATVVADVGRAAGPPLELSARRRWSWSWPDRSRRTGGRCARTPRSSRGLVARSLPGPRVRDGVRLRDEGAVAARHRGPRPADRRPAAVHAATERVAARRGAAPRSSEAAA